MEKISKKIKNNAMASYGLVLANIAFLFSKDPNINNPFVKSHTKTAILIHLGFLINTIIFVVYGLGISYNISYYHISDILAIIIYLILFGLLILGIYKAYNNETFKISETINLKNDYKLLDISDNGTFSEKDKLTIIITLIPFIGLIVFPKYKKNRLIINNVKINVLVSFIIISLYCFGNNNLANLLFLVYIIFIVFYGIYIFVKNEVININLSIIPNYTDFKIGYRTFKEYLANYFKNSKEFPSFKELFKKNQIKYQEEYKIGLKKLFNKVNFKLNKYIIYIPFVNFITFFNIDSKKQKHIINGLLISISLIILLLLGYFKITDYSLILFLLFPLFLGIGYLKAGIINYEIPVLYIFVNILTKIKNIFKKVKLIKNKNVETKLKVKTNS